MKNLMLMVVSVIALLAATTPAAGVAGFGDTMPDRFYTDGVQWMVDKDITTGTTAECFEPYESVTRGQVAAFIWRMEGSPADGFPDHTFTDVVASWQQDPVSWMLHNDITMGITPTEFGPERNLTRAELGAFLFRLEGEPQPQPLHPFGDVVKDWQHDPISWMFANDITTGTSPATFSPEDDVTRGQVATFFHRYKGSPAVEVDPKSPKCDRVGVHVGTWEAPEGEDGHLIVTIDIHGNFRLFDNHVGVCDADPGEIVGTGFINGAGHFEWTGDLACLPPGEPPFFLSVVNGDAQHMAVTDTLTAFDTCFSRNGFPGAGCP